MHSMPSVLGAIAKVNPFTLTVDAMRELWTGLPSGSSVWGSVVWAFVIIGVFAPLTVAKYRRTAGG